MPPRRNPKRTRKGQEPFEWVEGPGQTSGDTEEDPPHPMQWYFDGFEAEPLSDEHRERFDTLHYHRTLNSSRWFDIPTFHELGLYDSVKMLTERIGLWNFLSSPCQTFEGITKEFLATVEFDRATNIISFRLGFTSFRMTSTELAEHLYLPTEDVISMNETTTFPPDMSELRFKSIICDPRSPLNKQRVLNIKHPVLRYIQRTLALTLFGRGETRSCFKKPENLYLLCMLRRNNGEMHFQPNCGYYLAKHLYAVATMPQPNGIISCCGVITKLARSLLVNIHDKPVDPPITLDIPSLLHMQLISRSPDDDYYLSDGPGNYGYRLPLTTTIDPLRRSTWNLTDEPIILGPNAVPQPPPADEVPAQAQQAGPSNQELMDYMVKMNEAMIRNFSQMSTQISLLDNRIDEFEGPVHKAEDDAQMAKYYSHQIYEHFNIEPTEEPPTSPAERRRRHATQQPCSPVRRRASGQPEGAPPQPP